MGISNAYTIFVEICPAVYEDIAQISTKMVYALLIPIWCARVQLVFTMTTGAMKAALGFVIVYYHSTI